MHTLMKSSSGLITIAQHGNKFYVCRLSTTTGKYTPIDSGFTSLRLAVYFFNVESADLPTQPVQLPLALH